MNKPTNYTRAFGVIAFLFFVLGFITCMNDILIPFLKKMFHLNYFQSMLVQFSFFGAYFIASLVYYLFSMYGQDPISKMGYKKGILFSLLVSSVGCFVFYPAAFYKSYPLFLGALFILALGFAVLQIAINPYIAILGSAETASSRLNLSQAFNSFATAIAPIVGGFLVFQYFARWGEPLTDIYGQVIELAPGIPISIYGVQLPYLMLGFLFLLLFSIVLLTYLPPFIQDKKDQKPNAWRYKHLRLGVLAIFMYVGAEVTIGSFLIGFQEESLGYPEALAKSFLAFYWGGAMIGRFLGAISLGKENSSYKWIKMLITVVALFFFLYFAASLDSSQDLYLTHFLPFTIFILINLSAFRVGKYLPAKTLFYFALCASFLLILGLCIAPAQALWCFVAVGLFNSIMFPTIFTLAINQLQEHTSQGSSLLVMAILGGAIIPPLQGLVADEWGVHPSFFVPIFCYLYIAFYAHKGYKPQLGDNL